jgi:hypothetical protein
MRKALEYVNVAGDGGVHANSIDFDDQSCGRNSATHHLTAKRLPCDSYETYRTYWRDTGVFTTD